MKHNIFIHDIRNCLIMFLVFIIPLISSCNHSPFTKVYLSIDQVVDDLNKEYIYFEGFGYINSAKIHKFYSEDKIVDFEVKNSSMPEELLKNGINQNLFNEKQDLSIDLFQSLLHSLEEKQRLLFDSLASFKYSARFNIHSPNDTNIAVITLSPQKIKQALSWEPIEDKNEYALHVFIKGATILLPYGDETSICKSISIDQNNLIIHSDFYEKECQVDELDRQQMRAGIINQYKEGLSFNRNLLHNVFMTNRGIRYIFHGTISGKTVVIQLSSEEIYDIMNKRI